MHRHELSQLAIASAETDEDLEALIAVRRIVTPRARPIVANLRHALDSSEAGLMFIVARLGDEPVACGFVEGPVGDSAPADIAVVPDLRKVGIGSAVLAYISGQARTLGKDVLQFEVKKSDEDSRVLPRASWFSEGRRRGSGQLAARRPRSPTRLRRTASGSSLAASGQMSSRRCTRSTSSALRTCPARAV